MNPKRIRYINLDAYNAQGLMFDANKFTCNSRFICNYLSKEIRKLNVIGDGTYKMISIRLRTTPSECKFVCSSDAKDVLSVGLHISESDQIKYMNMTNLTDRYEFYLHLLEDGYSYASKHVDIPLATLFELHDKFRQNAYKNEWLWKRKLIKEYNLCLYFKCYFTTCDFRLELEVYDNKENALLTDGVIFQTGPDEIYYDKDFRKLVVSDNELMILDFLNRCSFKCNLDLLTKGIFNVEYSDYQNNRIQKIDEQISILKM